ncbi:MAG TPA: hypothetical protein VFA94_14415 [Acidimicrobiales bacterium]|nr:hypothetical protein [Acidimicrobiales bacterium]
MKAFLGLVIATLLLAGGAAVALRYRPVEVRSVVSDEPGLRAGQTEVTGTITFLRAESADAPPLPLPLTLTVAERGVGGATISGAVVGGKKASIVWDGGTPLVLAAAGSGFLDVAPAPVEISAAGIKWFLDGHPGGFAPGQYAAEAPVAVGVAGLATPRDGADFTAGPGTALVTHGGTTVKLALSPLVLQGPGLVRLEGQLKLRTTEATATATSLRFSDGPYRVQVTPGPAGLVVSALFQGARID